MRPAWTSMHTLLKKSSAQTWMHVPKMTTMQMLKVLKRSSMIFEQVMHIHWRVKMVRTHLIMFKTSELNLLSSHKPRRSISSWMQIPLILILLRM